MKNRPLGLVDAGIDEGRRAGDLSVNGLYQALSKDSPPVCCHVAKFYFLDLDDRRA